MKIEFYHIDAFEVPNYEPIYRQLIQLGVDARMVGVPGERNTAASGWFDYERFQQYCKERQIPFTTAADSSADLAVTTQNADILRDYTCPRVRLMYGPILFPEAWGLQAHSVQPFDAVLTHGRAYTESFSKWLRPDQLLVAGYPRYDDYFSGLYSKKAIRANWCVTEDKPVIVFLPTWDNNTGFDLFFPELVRLASLYHIIIRPHHCTMRLEPERVAMMRDSGLLILDHAFDLAEVYAAADLIISDVRSGALFEACLCDVPAVGMVLDSSEMHGWLARAGVGDMLSLCADPTQLQSAIQTALTSHDQATQRQLWADAHVAYRDGTAGLRAAEALIQFATRKSKMLAPTNLCGLLTPTFYQS